MAPPSDASSTAKDGYQTRHIEDKGSAENIETRLEERHIMRQNTEYFNMNPNRWARFRYVFGTDYLVCSSYSLFVLRNIIREPAAEFLGTMVLIMFGTAVDCQVVLSSNTSIASSPKGVRTPFCELCDLLLTIYLGLSISGIWMGCW